MDAIYYNKGYIRPRVAIVKSLASAISIGSGGSVGREGPIVQIGSAFGSTLGTIFPMLVRDRVALIAAGAGAGIAADASIDHFVGQVIGLEGRMQPGRPGVPGRQAVARTQAVAEHQDGPGRQLRRGRHG